MGIMFCYSFSKEIPNLNFNKSISLINKTLVKTTDDWKVFLLIKRLLKITNEEKV